MDYFNGGEICPRMTKREDPYYAGCGLYKCALMVTSSWSWPASRKSTSVLKIRPRPHSSVRRKSGRHAAHPSRGMPLRPPSKRNWTPAGNTHHADVQARFAELNIACAKVPPFRTTSVIRSTLPANRLLSGKQWTAAAPVRAEHRRNLKTTRGKAWRGDAVTRHGIPPPALKTLVIAKQILSEPVGKGPAKS